MLFRSVHIDVPFTISPEAERIYQEVKKNGVLELEEDYIQRKNVLGVLLTLQQLCHGFCTVENFNEPGVKLRKIDDNRAGALAEIIADIPPKEPLVVFTRFNQDIKDIKVVLDKFGRTYSELSGSKNELDEWQQGQTSVLISNIKSGSDGIDLSRSRYAVYYSHTTSLTSYKQSLKRIHRPPQRRQVVYFHLVAKTRKGQSMDEIIIEARKKNMEIIDYVTENGL